MDTITALDVHTMDYAAERSQVAAARRWVAGLYAGHSYADDLELVVSELVTNAIEHSRSGLGGTVSVTVAEWRGEVRVYVADDGTPVTEGEPASVPHLPEDGQELGAESGRGLVLVDALSSRWGYVPADGAGMTWCVLAGA